MATSLATQAYINAVRFYLNDTEELNVLLGEEESTDEKIEMCIYLAIEDYMSSDPCNIRYSPDNFPSFSLMLNGAIVWLLKSASILHARNKLNYSSGGLSVQLWGKDKDYMPWIQLMMSEYASAKLAMIRKINLSRALNQTPMGVHSDYWIGAFTSRGIG